MLLCTTDCWHSYGTNWETFQNCWPGVHDWPERDRRLRITLRSKDYIWDLLYNLHGHCCSFEQEAPCAQKESQMGLNCEYFVTQPTVFKTFFARGWLILICLEGKIERKKILINFFVSTWLFWFVTFDSFHSCQTHTCGIYSRH